MIKFDFEMREVVDSEGCVMSMTLLSIDGKDYTSDDILPVKPKHAIFVYGPDDNELWHVTEYKWEK